MVGSDAASPKADGPLQGAAQAPAVAPADVPVQGAAEAPAQAPAQAPAEVPPWRENREAATEAAAQAPAQARPEGCVSPADIGLILDTLAAQQARDRALAVKRNQDEHFFLDKVRTST
jgi:hypothetical protein